MAYICQATTILKTAVDNKVITVQSNNTVNVVFNKNMVAKSTLVQVEAVYTKTYREIPGTVGFQYTTTNSTQSMNKTTYEPMNGSTTPSGGNPRPGTGQFWPR